MLGNHGRSITKALFTPLARVLARLGVTPNMVTVAGTVASIAIAVVCIPRGWIWQGGIALAIVMFGDSVDGTLARMTTGGTRFGAFLDSTLDRLADGAVFGSLTAYAVFQMGDSPVRTWTVIAGICSIIGAATVPYARARGVGGRRGQARHRGANGSADHWKWLRHGDEPGRPTVGVRRRSHLGRRGLVRDGVPADLVHGTHD